MSAAAWSNENDALNTGATNMFTGYGRASYTNGTTGAYRCGFTLPPLKSVNRITHIKVRKVVYNEANGAAAQYDGPIIIRSPMVATTGQTLTIISFAGISNTNGNIPFAYSSADDILIPINAPLAGYYEFEILGLSTTSHGVIGTYACLLCEAYCEKK